MSTLIFSAIYSLFFPTCSELFADLKHLLILSAFCFTLPPASPAGFLHGVYFQGFLLLPEKPVTPFPPSLSTVLCRGARDTPCLAYIENAGKALCILCVLFYTKVATHVETRGKPKALLLRNCPLCFLNYNLSPSLRVI